MSEYEDAYFGVEWNREEYDKPWHDTEFLKAVYETDERPSYRDIGSEVGVSATMIKRNMPDDAKKGGEGLPYEDIAMFSGGHDSLVSTHYTMEQLDGDCVLHINTKTGIDKNQQFVEDVCEEFEWPLEVVEPNTTLEEFAEKYGFPKAQSHSWIYRYLKENPLGHFVTSLESDEPTMYTGVRKAESDRRMENVTTEDEVNSNGRWWWSSPIADFTEEDIHDYIADHDLPRNPVVETIGRSGECFCGAYSDRFSELAVLQEHYPDQYEWIMSVEEHIQSVKGPDDDYAYWGTSGMSSDDLQELMESDDSTDMMLCADCEGVGHRTMQCDIQNE